MRRQHLAAVTATDLHFGTRPDDPTGVRDCTTCPGSAVVDGVPCPACVTRQDLRTAWWRGSNGPDTVASLVAQWLS